MKITCIVSAVCMAILWGSPLAAQDAEETETSSNMLEEVMVVATRREQNIQDVAIAVTAISGEMVEQAGINDIRDIKQLSPSFNAISGQSSAGATTIYIRGIGTGGDNPGFESAVGTFVDGVYRSRSNLGVSDWPEIEHVEVLRGPQGTLFGKNTSAGALNIITKGPEYEFGGFAEAGLTNYNGYAGRAAITGPIGEDFAAYRLEGSVRKRDGFVEDLNGGPDQYDTDRASLRGQLRFDPNDRLAVRIIADVSSIDQHCCQPIRLNMGPLSPAVIAATPPNLVAIPPIDFEAYEIASTPGLDFREKVDEFGFSAQVDYDFEASTLTSITAYRDWDLTRNQDIDYAGLHRAYREGYSNQFKTFTQELRLQGEAG